jgi:hypothetical protein
MKADDNHTGFGNRSRRDGVGVTAQHIQARLEFYLAKARLHDTLFGELNERQ